MRACLLADGTYDLGGLVVRVKAGHARLEDGTIAGSTLVMNQALNNFRKNTGLPLEEVIKLATLNPARILRLKNRKGNIAPGMDADLARLDGDLNVRMTVVGGRIFAGNC